MLIEDLLAKRGVTIEAGVPHAMLNVICSRTTKVEKYSAGTNYKLAKTLGVSMELPTETDIHQAEREHAYEVGLSVE